MRLITGPAGSGKTTYIVDQLRHALRRGDGAVRLLVPTATMAQHLQNLLAREGFVFRRGLIQTFSGFVENWAGDLPQVSDSALYLIVEDAARRVNRPEFEQVVHMRGFCASLAGTILEFSSAGCDSGRLAGHLPDSLLSAAFLAVYREVDRELATRGLALRARRLELAAERIANEGLGGIATLWLDGFHALPDPEMRVIRAMARHAEVVLARGEEPEQTGLEDCEVTRFPRSRPAPAQILVKAAGVEREAEEIARRILEQAAAGRTFREMGIIVRNAESYVPVLRAVLERFGIPARFYFDAHLEEHAAVRFLCGAVRAMLGGWDHAETLAVLRLAPRFAESTAMDRFDFDVRQQIPNAGLGPLKTLLLGDDSKPHTSGKERLLHKIDSLGALEEWRSFALTPKEWTDRFRTLRNLFRVGQPADGVSHEAALLNRGQAAALNTFDQALGETAEALDGRHAIGIEEFFRALESVLRITPLRLSDERRNAVHVLSAPEARQWVLPVIFICGMVEKEFPRFHKQDPFFPDSARCELNGAGIRVRTAAEFEREERALFDSAVSRASSLVTLTYPEFNARGERNLPSLYLESIPEPAQESPAVRPRPRQLLTARPPAEVRAPALLEALRERTASVSPTGLETYLQCAYQYFAGRLLRLKTAPPRPEKRLDFLTQGSIVHETLAQWWAQPQEIELVFEAIFAETLEDKHIPCAYHTERARNAMLDDLRAFVAGDEWPRASFHSRIEEPFAFALDDVVTIRGKIDRLDVTDDGQAYVIDYKYSNSQNTKAKLTNESLVQAPIYMMAAERVFGVRPAGVFYVGLKRGPLYVGWSKDRLMKSEPPPEDWLAQTERSVLRIVEEIRGGRVEVLPSDPDKCRFCDFSDVCRVQVRQAEAEAAGRDGGRVTDTGEAKIPYTSDQLDAIDVSRRFEDACVVAGPGSGKTTVLVEYFRLLVEQGVDPLRILAITFTEKAASNMRKKLGQAFQESPARRARMERAWVSTVHGFCSRLLKENAVFAGVDPEYKVADERDSWRLQQESMAAAMDGLFQEHPVAIRALIRGLSSMDFEEAVLNAYDAMRGAGVAVADLARFPAPAGPTVQEVAATLRALQAESLTAWSYSQKEHLQAALEGARRVVDAATPVDALRAVEAFSCNLQKCKRGTGAYHLLKRLREQIEDAKYGLITEFYTSERRLLLDILLRFDASYRERKRQAGVLDFADLEEFSVRLLERNPGTLERLRAQFDHVLMDEFQDTNGQQARLLKLVRSPGRFYAVGDINQSIFGFRHAEPQGFAEYRDHIESSGAHLVNLVDNFRSRADILSAVETVAEGRPGIVQRRLVAGRRFQTELDCSVELLAAPDLRVEAQWVAQRIGELCESEFRFEQVAVLVRNTEVIGEFSNAFDEVGVPYVVNRGRGFYESREVNDLAHLLRVIANPRDEVSVATVLRSPLVEASDEALLRLRLRGENIGTALMFLTAEDAAGFGAEDAAKLTRIRDRLREWRERREYVTFDRLLLQAMDDCGYRGENGSRAAANIDKFLAQARTAASRMSLDAFVEELALIRVSNPREPDAPPEDSVNAVQVMTVHSAKGLEYPVVFVAAIHKGVESKPPVVAFSRHLGLGARWRNPAVREDKDDLYMHALREEWKKREADESDRLLYVAMTRAEEHLVLSYSGKPANWAKAVVESLHPDTPGVQTRTAPDGREWKLRVLRPEGPPDAEGRPARQAAEDVEEVRLLDAPVVTGQEDGNATVTALARFAKCPREYYLAQYLGFEGKPRATGEEAEELSASELGTQVHALLAGAPVADPDEVAVKLAEVFRKGRLGRRLANATRVEREFDFLLAVEDLVIRGQIDLWFEEGGELCIVDYKTDAVGMVEAHQRAQDYGLQLRLYAMAIEKVAGRAPDRAWLHFLRPDSVVEVDLGPSLLDAPEQVVRDFQEAQSTLHFPLVEGEHCRRCQFYKSLCPAG